MVLSRFLRWLLSIAHANRKRNRATRCGSYEGVRSDRYERNPPPDVRVDPSGGRNPLTRPPSPSLEAEIKADSLRARSILHVLPLEVRQQIWVDVLGGHCFHLEIWTAVLTGRLCVSPNPNTCERGRGGCRLSLSNEDVQREKNLLLPILLSCKQM
jgi:hypothetical protein